ncbi:MAG: hypothetical protein N2559_02195 [Anaerolineae bacterium]|nr:hypothetical protein [Anaerolineae bacterium]
MCAICAALPTVAALGIAAEGEQRRRQQEAQARSAIYTARLQPRSIRILTALAMLILFLIAAIYHTHQSNSA